MILPHNNTVDFLAQAGSRKVLLDVVPIVWNDVSALMKSSVAGRSPLLRKYLVKLTQRIGLVCLPHRSLSWHYKVRTAETLSSSKSETVHFICLRVTGIVTRLRI